MKKFNSELPHNSAGLVFDLFTPIFKKIFKSPYVNLGYWNKTTKTIAQAQEKLVKQFGKFSQLKKNIEIVDIGCGTGEQDLYFTNYFQCKKIIGINVSKVQIDIAKNKIKNKKKYSSKIEFKVGDAHNLIKFPKEICDRVLSLECTQYLDKKKFIQGAWHVLKAEGYLCIADPLFNLPYKIDIKKFPPLLDRIKEKEIKSKFGFMIQSKYDFFLQEKMNDLTCFQKKIHMSYDDFLKMIEDEKFKIEKISDISHRVIPFYSFAEKKILKILKDEKKYSFQQADLYITFLVLSYLNNCAYKAGLAKFYLIRAKKNKF